jgi:hypothetical protein
MFFAKTWPVLLLLSTIWVLFLLIWNRLHPPLFRELSEFDEDAATSHYATYIRSAAKIRNLWICGGIFALLAYVMLVAMWPRSNWITDSIVPFFRLFGELLVGFAFSQAVDLMFRPAPILADLFSRSPDFWKLGSRGPIAMSILRNINLIFAFMLIIESLVHYQGTISEMMLSISAALFIGRYVDSPNS